MIQGQHMTLCARLNDETALVMEQLPGCVGPGRYGVQLCPQPLL
jgi:hypothetical protein